MSTTATPDAKACGRSRVTNGAELFLAHIDGRSREARRFRDIYQAFVAHLGGEEWITETRRHLAKRASALATWCEVEEAKLAMGGELDITAYTTSVNALRRLLVDLGLERVARDITPSLEEYIAEHDREKAETA